eukprot:751705-Hanusia_phi.AAC.1
MTMNGRGQGEGKRRKWRGEGREKSSTEGDKRGCKILTRTIIEEGQCWDSPDLRESEGDGGQEEEGQEHATWGDRGQGVEDAEEEEEEAPCTCDKFPRLERCERQRGCR